MVDTQLRAKAIVSTETAPEKSNASTQIELVRKESVQVVVCNRCPVTPPGEKAVPAQHTQFDDLLQHMAKLQETVNRLCSVRGAETETCG